MMDYKFRNSTLLEEALTHPSFSRDKESHSYNYERLEFLGDRVLGLVIAEILFNKHSDMNEGSLAVVQAHLVNSSCLAEVAKTIGLGDMLRMDLGEEAIGGRRNPRNLENAMEALIAAIYLDSDYATIASIVTKWWEPYLANSEAMDVRDSKSLLQELAQRKRLPLPHYKVITQTGPAHQPTFSVAVSLDGIGAAEGHGLSKKAAELAAAHNLLQIVGNHD